VLKHKWMPPSLNRAQAPTSRMTSCETRPHLLLRANECSDSGRRLLCCPWQRAATALVNKTHCNHQGRFARFQHPGLANIAKLHPSATITCWNPFSGSRLFPSPIGTAEYLDCQKRTTFFLIEKTLEEKPSASQTLSRLNPAKSGSILACSSPHQVHPRLPGLYTEVRRISIR
jgi:hypothetical protein